jgi:histidinol-phosphate/aromatic aminotransferase/cobyric acid decarboxylase-like protein
VRITIGTREQMRKAVVALNEVLADLKLQAIQDTP